MKTDIRYEASDFPLVPKHWDNMLNTVAVPFSAIFGIGSFGADLLLQTRWFSVWILHLYCASTAGMWTMGRPEIQKWLYRFIIGQIIFFTFGKNWKCSCLYRHASSLDNEASFSVNFFTVEVYIWDSDRQSQSGSNPVLGWCPFSSENLNRRKIVRKPS